MGKKWSIGRITFHTKEDYQAGQRDLKRIQQLLAGVNLDNAGEAQELYRVLQGQPFLFESELGAVFRSCLSEQGHGFENFGELFGLQLLPSRKLSSGRQRKSRQGVKRKVSAADKGKRKKRWILAAGLAASTCVILFALYRIFSYDILSYISAKKMEALAACILTPYEAEVSEEHRIADLVASGLYTEEEAWQMVKGEAFQAGQDGQPPGNAQQPDSQAAGADGRQVLYQYSVLYERNPDMAGWIRIEDTVVNYPVMLTPGDEEYYLKRGFDKKSDINGIPFMDTRCTITEPVSNYLIYGHNMKNGSMFSSLLKYEDRAFYLEHPLIYFDTVYEAGVYEIVGAFRTAVAYVGQDVYRYYQFIQAASQEEFDEYIGFVKENSFYETGITAEYGTQLLTLSTCDRSIEDGRFVVVARKMDLENGDAARAAE